MDVSPGNTLRDRRRIEELHSPASSVQEVVEVLQESPRASRNRRKANEAQQVNNNSIEAVNFTNILGATFECANPIVEKRLMI